MPRELVGKIRFSFIAFYLMEAIDYQKKRRKKRKIIYCISRECGIKYKNTYETGHGDRKKGENNHCDISGFIHFYSLYFYLCGSVSSVFIVATSVQIGISTALFCLNYMRKLGFLLFFSILVLTVLLLAGCAITIPSTIPIPK